MKITVACEIGKHDRCNGWGDERDTLDEPKQPVKCECYCHGTTEPTEGNDDE